MNFYYRMKTDKDTYEIIFLARGGQGAKTASELLAHTAVREGKFVKAFPHFGPERSGAPTKMFLRISDSEIRTQEPITDPDMMVVMDETVMESDEMIKKLGRDKFLVINSKFSREKMKEVLPDFKGGIHTIDATGMALTLTGNPNPNTVLIGKLIQVAGMVSLEGVIEVFREYFTPKLGKDLTEKNIAAIYAGHDAL